MSKIITTETIESKIYLIRGQKVMLDKDLAELYGVTSKVLLQAVKRNEKRVAHPVPWTQDKTYAAAFS